MENTPKRMENDLKFNLYEVDVIRAKALASLISNAEKEGVDVRQVIYFQNGFQVMFEGIEGDAVIHDYSYCREFGEWESYGMPWDFGDVSVHTPEHLAKLLGALKRGEDWETINKEGE